MALAAHGVVDEHGHLFGLADGCAQGAVVLRLKGALHTLGAAVPPRLFAEQGVAVGAGPLVAHTAVFLVHSHIPENHFPATLGADEHVGPDRIVDFPLHAVGGVAMGVPGLVHPAALLLHLAQNALRLPFKCGGVHGGVVVVGDEGGGGGKVNEHGFARAQAGDTAVAVPDPALRVHAVAQAFYRGFVPAQLRGYARHARAAKTVQHNVAGVGVVQNVAHDGFVGHLGVVGVGVVDGVVLALAHVGREGVAVVAVLVVGGQAQFTAQRGPFLLPARHNLGQKGIGAGGVIGWVGERENILLLPDGKAGNGAEFRVLQGGAQAFPVLLAFSLAVLVLFLLLVVEVQFWLIGFWLVEIGHRVLSSSRQCVG